uniref:Uncharacterized protein n=1 Tax=Triticum urartu TaxID=4572 RepID=A0A8R7UF91_TRIUA
MEHHHRISTSPSGSGHPRRCRTSSARRSSCRVAVVACCRATRGVLPLLLEQALPPRVDSSSSSPRRRTTPRTRTHSSRRRQALPP